MLTALRLGVATFALACASSVFAQTSTTAAKWSPPRTADGVPDLTGVWVIKTATPLERPDSLKDKARFTDEEVAELRARAQRLFSDPDADAPAGDNLFLAVTANVPRYRNVNATQQAVFDPNVHDREFDNRTSLITDPADGKVPPLTEDGRKRQAQDAPRNFQLPALQRVDDATAERQLTEAIAKLAQPTTPAELANSLRCITWGIPRIGGNAFFTSHFQIVQSPGYVVIVQEVNHEPRIIPLDGRPHIGEAIRQWNGDSRGRWEGNTLVVDTTNFSPKSYFRGSAENLHLVERFTRTSADVIEYAATIDDATTWTRPWTATMPLKRTDDAIYEFACHEGNYYTIRGILSPPSK
jgi:hypothetical protein